MYQLTYPECLLLLVLPFIVRLLSPLRQRQCALLFPSASALRGGNARHALHIRLFEVDLLLFRLGSDMHRRVPSGLPSRTGKRNQGTEKHPVGNRHLIKYGHPGLVSSYRRKTHIPLGSGQGDGGSFHCLPSWRPVCPRSVRSGSLPASALYARCPSAC